MLKVVLTNGNITVGIAIMRSLLRNPTLRLRLYSALLLIKIIYVANVFDPSE